MVCEDLKERRKQGKMGVHVMNVLSHGRFVQTVSLASEFVTHLKMWPPSHETQTSSQDMLNAKILLNFPHRRGVECTTCIISGSCSALTGFLGESHVFRLSTRHKWRSKTPGRREGSAKRLAEVETTSGVLNISLALALISLWTLRVTTVRRWPPFLILTLSGPSVPLHTNRHARAHAHLRTGTHAHKKYTRTHTHTQMTDVMR